MGIGEVAERGLLMRELGWGIYTKNEQEAKKGNHGDAKPGENYQVAKKRAEGHFACLSGNAWKFSWVTSGQLWVEVR